MVSALDAAHSCGCYEKSWLPAAAAAQAAVNGARAAPWAVTRVDDMHGNWRRRRRRRQAPSEVDSTVTDQLTSCTVTLSCHHSSLEASRPVRDVPEWLSHWVLVSSGLPSRHLAPISCHHQRASSDQRRRCRRGCCCCCWAPVGSVVDELMALRTLKRVQLIFHDLFRR